MNVLILNDHCVKNPAELKLLKGLCDGIVASHKIQWVDAHQLEVQPCQNCQKCHPFGECVLPEDDAHHIGRLLFAADALVLGLSANAPNLTVAGSALLERCRSALAYRDENGASHPWRKHRPAAVIALGAAKAARPGAGTDPLRPGLRSMLNTGGFTLVGTLQECEEMDSAAALPLIQRAQNLGRELSERMYFAV